MTTTSHLRALLQHPAISDDETVERVARAIASEVLPPHLIEELPSLALEQARAAIAALLEPIGQSLLVSGVISGAVGRIEELEAENARLSECLTTLDLAIRNYPQAIDRAGHFEELIRAALEGK